MLLEKIKELFYNLRKNKNDDHKRVLPFGDYFVDRWEKAEYLGFGKGSSVYDNVVVIGKVKVGENTWIGPNVVLDGSGGLEIGSHCSISAGTQIYSHDTVGWAVTGGKKPYEYSKTVISNNCYIGPNVIIQKGIRIGESVTIGSNSFVNQDIPSFSKAVGNPIKILDKENNEKKNNMY